MRTRPAPRTAAYRTRCRRRPARSRTRVREARPRSGGRRTGRPCSSTSRRRDAARTWCRSDGRPPRLRSDWQSRRHSRPLRACSPRRGGATGSISVCRLRRRRRGKSQFCPAAIRRRCSRGWTAASARGAARQAPPAQSRLRPGRRLPGTWRASQDCGRADETAARRWP